VTFFPGHRILFLPEPEDESAMAAGNPVDGRAGNAITGAANDTLPPNPNGQPSPSEALNLASPMFNIHPSPQGIGGWLVLVAIGLVITPFLLIRYLLLDLHSLRLPARTLIGLRVPGLPTLVGLEFFDNALLLAGLVFLVVLFFREKRQFPRIYQLWLAFALVGKVVELTLSFHLGVGSSWEGAANLVANLHSKLGFSVLKSAIAAIVWIGYFEVSERVKATFVH
jgi:Protein of unknown function (DUF2569)